MLLMPKRRAISEIQFLTVEMELEKVNFLVKQDVNIFESSLNVFSSIRVFEYSKTALS